MFHASKWHGDPRFYSPMTLLDSGEHVFIRDCVSCAHHVLPSVTSMVIRFFVSAPKCRDIVLGSYVRGMSLVARAHNPQ